MKNYGNAPRRVIYSIFILHSSLFILKMMRFYRFLLLFLISLAAFTAVFAAGEENAVPSDPQLVQIFVYLNALRTRYHIDVLAFDEHLNTAAQRQAEYLAEIGRLDKYGPAGEPVRERAMDAGYGGDKDFTVDETSAQVWTDTDAEYLIEKVWRQNQASVQAIFDPKVRQVGIGYADAADKHRYYVLILAGLDDGTDDYSMTRPTYDYRTPKPTASATPTPQELITSTANPDGGVYHVVQEGETFSEIALAYGLDWYTLSVRNNIKLSDTTPVVIMEGQVLVIEPTFTLTPTPTSTKTPLPPTNTPRPTFTAGPGASGGIVQTPVIDRLPTPDWYGVLAKTLRWKTAVGWTLIFFSTAGIALSLKKRK